MLEQWLGHFGFPVAIVAVALIAAFTFYYYDDNHSKNQLRSQIVKVCASSEDRVTCANDLVAAVNKVK